MVNYVINVVENYVRYHSQYIGLQRVNFRMVTVSLRKENLMIRSQPLKSSKGDKNIALLADFSNSSVRRTGDR